MKIHLIYKFSMLLATFAVLPEQVLRPSSSWVGTVVILLVHFGLSQVHPLFFALVSHLCCLPPGYLITIPMKGLFTRSPREPTVRIMTPAWPRKVSKR